MGHTKFADLNDYNFLCFPPQDLPSVIKGTYNNVIYIIYVITCIIRGACIIGERV